MDERRKNIRLNGHDYSEQGAYFITVCTRDRQPIFWQFGTSVGATCGRPSLSAEGRIVDDEIRHLSAVYPNIWVEKYVIMPNHIHFLLCIGGMEDGRPQAAPTVSRILKQFKGAASKRCGRSLWQKGFYDHIIRDDNVFLTKWNYIDANPARWQEDAYYGG